tara:strand:- start:6822 stop:7406 length:585 start_codon:yes stop_codon:yes gene_type:complete
MSTWQNYKALGALDKLSVVSGVAGVFSGAYGAFAAARSERLKTKSLALNLQHKKDMKLFNIRQKEAQAQWLERVFQQQYQAKSIRQGNQRSKARTSFAARGIQMGVGSTKDVFVSSEILATIDKLTMNSNKVRAVENKRLEGVGLGIQANMLGVSESNMFATASSIDPFMNMSSSLLTGTSNLMGNLPSSLFKK